MIVPVERATEHSRPLLLVMFLAFAAACGEEEPSAEEQREPEHFTSRSELVASVSGLETPESVRYDPVADAYFVSNIVGGPGTRDGVGFISVVGADGTVRELRFIDGGKKGATLNAPKGMAISGDTLWVADIDVLRAFHRTTGAPLTTVDLVPHGAVFLNDVVVGADGAKYVTDTGLRFDAAGAMSHVGPDRIFRIDGTLVTVAAEGDALGAPNGIAAVPSGGFVLAPNGIPTLQRWAGPAGGSPEVLAEGPGSYDGVEVLADGRLLVSSWADSTVHEVIESEMRPLIRGVNSPADIGVDTRRGNVAIPLFLENRMEIWSIPPVPAGDEAGDLPKSAESAVPAAH
ncbi:MAG: hypothetical protein KY464_09525 [Gemmatimonadetes bacterium]|nr:hypothetical protein [Gemmatimonadota bacterium]